MTKTQDLRTSSDRALSHHALTDGLVSTSAGLGAIAAKRVLVLAGDERRGRVLARTLRLMCDVECHGIGAPGPNKSAADLVVTLAPSVGSETAIRILQTAIRPFLNRSIPVLCLLDAPTRRDEVQARAIGATTVLATNSPSLLVAGTIRSLLAPPHPQRLIAQREALHDAVQGVGLVLADLMDAAATGMRIDGHVCDQAGKLMLKALENDGIGRWMATVGLIHDQTYRHCLLMAGVMAAFTLQLGFRAADCQRLTRAAILHDIGKALIPIEIINKAGALTEQEMLMVRGHAAYGHELLLAQGGHDPQVLDVVRHHHEYLDGSGYPDALRGDAISDAARIATISDVFAALVERRAYKESLSAKEAFVLLEQMSGKLDADLLRAFRRVFEPV